MATKEGFVRVVRQMAERLGDEEYQTELEFHWLKAEIELLNEDSPNPLLVAKSGIPCGMQMIVGLIEFQDLSSAIKDEKLESYLLNLICNRIASTANAIKGGMLLKFEERLEERFPIWHPSGSPRTRPLSWGTENVPDISHFSQPE